jgi:hypothetical protein
MSARSRGGAAGDHARACLRLFAASWLASAAGQLGTAAALSGRAPARMLVSEACPAWSVTSACGACGCALA